MKHESNVVLVKREYHQLGPTCKISMPELQSEDQTKHKIFLQTTEQPHDMSEPKSKKSLSQSSGELRFSKIPQCYQPEHPMQISGELSSIPNHILKFCQTLCDSIEAVFGVFAFTPAKSSQDSLKKHGNHLSIPFCTSEFIKKRIMRYKSKFVSMERFLTSYSDILGDIAGVASNDRDSHYNTVSEFASRIKEIQLDISELERKLHLVESKLQSISFGRTITKTNGKVPVKTQTSKKTKVLPMKPIPTIDKNKCDKSQLLREKQQINHSLSEARKRLATYTLGLNNGLQQIELSSNRSDCQLLMESICRLEAICISKYILWIEKLVEFLGEASKRAPELADTYFQGSELNSKEKLSNCFDEWIRQMMLQKILVSDPPIPSCPSFMDIILADPELRCCQKRLLKVVTYSNSLKYFMSRAGSKHFSCKGGENIMYSAPHRALEDTINALNDSSRWNETQLPEFLFTWRQEESKICSDYPVDRAPLFRLSPELRLEIVQPFNSPFNMIFKLPPQFARLCTPALLEDNWSNLLQQDTDYHNNNNNDTNTRIGNQQSLLTRLFNPDDDLDSVSLYLNLRTSSLNEGIKRIYPNLSSFDQEEFNQSSKFQKSSLSSALSDYQITMKDQPPMNSNKKASIFMDGNTNPDSISTIHLVTPPPPQYFPSSSYPENFVERETEHYEILKQNSESQQTGGTLDSRKDESPPDNSKTQDSAILENLLQIVRSLATTQEEMSVKLNAFTSAQKFANRPNPPNRPSQFNNSSHIFPQPTRKKLRTSSAIPTDYLNSDGSYSGRNHASSSTSSHSPESEKQHILLGSQRMPEGTSKELSELSSQIWPSVNQYLGNTFATNADYHHSRTSSNQHGVSQDDIHLIHAGISFPWESSRQRTGSRNLRR